MPAVPWGQPDETEEVEDAHVDSEHFPLSEKGIREASDFLKGYRVNAKLVLP